MLALVQEGKRLRTGRRRPNDEKRLSTEVSERINLIENTAGKEKKKAAASGSGEDICEAARD